MVKRLLFKKLILIINCLLYSFYCFSQNDKTLDSLIKDSKIIKHDTLQIQTFINLGTYFENSIPDSAIKYYEKAINLIKLNSNAFPYLKAIQASIYRNIGMIYYNQGNYNESLDYFDKSFRLLEEMLETAKKTNHNERIKDQKKCISKCFISIGTIYYFQNNYDKAIYYYTKSLKTFEDLISIENKTGNLTNIKRFKQGLSVCYNNIAMVNSDKANKNKSNSFKRDSLFKVAINDYERSFAIIEELGDKLGMSKCYNNFGATYKEIKKYDLALEFFNKALKIKEELGDKNGTATVWGNLADLHINIADSTNISTAEKNNHYRLAVKFGLKAFDLAKSINAKYLTAQEAVQLQKAYIALGMTKKALEFTEIASIYNDSLINEEQTQSLAEMETKYQAEKKQLEIEKLEKQKALDSETIARKIAESKKQRIIIFFFIIGFIVILIFSIIVFRLFMAKKRANVIISVKNIALEQANEEIKAQRDEIEAQRDLVIIQKNQIEEIHEEVTSSIRYAQRIQGAILPSIEQLNELLGEHFILYKPRNIVSGDFYWATRVNKWLIFCVADCTGHGVPGAFMSMLGISYLNEIVRKEEVTNAADVLNHLRESVIASLKQNSIKNDRSAQIGVVDGMDIALCVLDTETMKLQFAGANNSVYIVKSQKLKVESTDSNLQLSNFELYELKGDKMPISVYLRMEPFKLEEYQMQSGDMIYLFSDGFADQFGGVNGKKFKYNQFKDLLLNNSIKPLSEQKSILESTFYDWKNTCKQVDDITVLGIKI